MADRRTRATTPDEQAGFLADLLREGQLVWKLMGDPRVATATKVMLPLLAVLYFLSPVDLIPDFLPVLGQMDDLAVLALAVKLFVTLAPPQVVAEYREAIRHRAPARGPAAPAPEGETVDADYRVID